MKVSPVFIVVLVLAIGCAIGAVLEDHDSGFRAGAITFAVIGALAALYNRFHNGSWFGDFSGGK